MSALAEVIGAEWEGAKLSESMMNNAEGEIKPLDVQVSLPNAGEGVF